MEALIQITTDAQGTSVVSARELHGFLGVKTKFVDWFKDRVRKYGLAENQDFVSVEGFSENSEKGGRPETDYALTLDCAKELAMVQSNQRGKEARQYFIDCEKQLRQKATLPGPKTDPALLQILQQQSQLMAGQQSQISYLQNQIDQLRVGRRIARPLPPRPMPGLRPNGFKDMRTLVIQQVNDYCLRLGADHAETYNYLYQRMQSVFGIDVWRLRWDERDSIIDVIEQHGHLERFYSLVMAELAYSN